MPEGRALAIVSVAVAVCVGYGVLDGGGRPADPTLEARPPVN